MANPTKSALALHGSPVLKAAEDAAFADAKPVRSMPRPSKPPPRRTRTLQEVRREREHWRHKRDRSIRFGDFVPTDENFTLDLSEVFLAFPAERADSIDNSRLGMRVRVAVAKYLARRATRPERPAFKAMARRITRRVQAIQAELVKPSAPYSVRVAVLNQVDDITELQTVAMLRAELDNFAAALDRAVSDEGEGGWLVDAPGQGLVYDLAGAYLARTGRKPSPKLTSDETQHRDVVDGNRFKQFVLLIEKALLKGVRAELVREAQRSGTTVSKRDLERESNRYELRELCAAIVFAVKLRRKERWV